MATNMLKKHTVTSATSSVIDPWFFRRFWYPSHGYTTRDVNKAGSFKAKAKAKSLKAKAKAKARSLKAKTKAKARDQG